MTASYAFSFTYVAVSASMSIASIPRVSQFERQVLSMVGEVSVPSTTCPAGISAMRIRPDTNYVYIGHDT